MMRNGLKLLLLTLPLAAAGAGYLAYTVNTKAPPAQVETGEIATPVRVITAAETSIRPVVTGFGLVAPAKTFEAIAQVAGTVAWVNPELARGAILPAGAELVRIASEDYEIALAQAEANVGAAEAKLTELSVSEDNQRAALEIERDVLALRADELARSEALLEGGARAQATVDTARAAWLAQRQKVQTIESTIALIPAQRAGLEESAAAARAAGDAARLNLARTTLTLPFDARVAQVSVEEGRFLRAGEVAAVLDGTDRAEIEAQVPIAELRRLLRLAAPDAAAFAADPTAMTSVLRGLDLGAEVRLNLGDDALRWSGHVDRVSDMIDPKTGTLGVIVVVDAAYGSAVPGAQPPLTKGMFVEVSIAGRPVTGLAVPRSALWDGTLFVAGDGDRLERRHVSTTLIQDRIALITNGISNGDRVVVSDLLVPLESMALAPVADEALTAELGSMR
ncbi:MAG: hypothetical protein KDK53_18515 [Maritimibacter sp.]|nr:hypothetical protein [Maritimibacter sp.]